ncbi:MAG: RluA family pseudouridine synthase [Alphaproteobacteria bacterium]
MEKITLKIAPDEDDVRIDRLLKRHFPMLSQGSIEKSLRNGLIKLDNIKVPSNHRVKSEQTIEIAKILTEVEIANKPKPTIKISENSLKDLRNSIIFTNEDMVVLNKPSGMASQGGSKIKNSIDVAIKQLPEFKDAFPKLVHRLDKDTSGVMVLALNHFSAAKLAEGFKKKTINKKYLALVIGRPPKNEGVIDEPIAKISENNYDKIKAVTTGDKAITYYKVIDSLSNKASLIEFTPVTGRTHQIRVHAKILGTPIIGDIKYGYIDDSLNIPQNILHLHSALIEIDDLRNKNYSFSAPLPKHMKESIKMLGLNRGKI